MGFRIDNDQHRQRISITPDAMAVLERDVIDFNLAGLGELVNAILSHAEKHNLTCESKLLRYRKESAEYLKKAGIDSDKNGVLDKLCDSKKKELIEAIGQNKTHRRGNIGKNIYVKQSVLRWLESDDNTEDEYYDGSLLLYFNCMLEDYVKKDLYTRESIAVEELISKLSLYIRDGEWVNVYWPDGRSVKIFPVKILPDRMYTHAYLACYRLDQTTVFPASFRISSLPSDLQTAHGNNPDISKADIERMDSFISERRVDFLSYETTDIVVRMSPRGMKNYVRTARLRPDMTDSSICEDGSAICTFHCTTQQAKYYFAGLGKDVEILEPSELRAEFKKMFRQALNLYS